MLALERVFSTVEQAKGAVCETCIPLVAATGPDQAEQLAKLLLEQGIFDSSQGTCSICGGTGTTFRIVSKTAPAQTFPVAEAAAFDDRLRRIEDQLRRLVAWSQINAQSPKVVAPATVSRTPVYLGGNIVLCWLLDRFRFFVDSTDWSMTAHLLSEGCWEMNITNLFARLIRPGDTVMDIGAGFGYYTVVGADAVGPAGKVFAIEANPSSFQTLGRNIHINGFDGRVNAFHIDGVALDDLIPQGAVDVIKIDVKGGEVLAFEGMTKLLERSRNVKIIVRWAPAMIRNNGRDPAEFLKRTREMGFEAWRITGDSRIERFNEAELCEAPATHTLYFSRPLA